MSALTSWWRSAIDWLLGLLGIHRRPGQVFNTKVILDMTTATISWALPTVSKSQHPIDHVLVELSADGGANFAALTSVRAADPQTAKITDIEGGTWIVRLTVEDSAGTSGPAVSKSFDVPFAPPGAVQNVAVVLS